MEMLLRIMPKSIFRDDNVNEDVMLRVSLGFLIVMSIKMLEIHEEKSIKQRLANERE